MKKYEVIDLFEDNFTTLNTHGHYTEEEENEAIKKAIEALKKYKYRDPDFHADWQPIEDGNPSPGLYFITWEGKINATGNVCRYIEMAEFYLENEYDEDSGRWNLDHITERNYTDIKVIAWMDLPDKYEGDLV